MYGLGLWGGFIEKLLFALIVRIRDYLPQDIYLTHGMPILQLSLQIAKFCRFRQSVLMLLKKSIFELYFSHFPPCVLHLFVLFWLVLAQMIQILATHEVTLHPVSARSLIIVIGGLIKLFFCELSAAFFKEGALAFGHLHLGLLLTRRSLTLAIDNFLDGFINFYLLWWGSTFSHILSLGGNCAIFISSIFIVF